MSGSLLVSYMVFWEMGLSTGEDGTALATWQYSFEFKLCLLSNVYH